jgi:ubiquinone/menaquinone biosynthesis C-methylase UbiE
MSYVYMKVLESAPARYDRGMRILTLGRLARVRRDIAAGLHPSEDRVGPSVLDLGCGTGALALELARQGCRVTGIDVSLAMLAQAARRVQDEGLGGRVTLRELGVAELDTALPDASFDAVTATLLFSELSPDERDYALGQAWRLLVPGGRLFIADEVRPASAPGRTAKALLRLPFALVAYVLTQNTTRPVHGLRAAIARHRFELVETRGYLAGTLRLFVARKGEST